MVPALLGWIDEAKKKQAVLEARNVYIATQTIADEQYAKGEKKVLDLDDVNVVKRIREIADVSTLKFEYVTVISNAEGTTATHDGFTINGMGITFTPTGKAKTYAVLAGDTWEVYTSSTDASAPAAPTANIVSVYDTEV